MAKDEFGQVINRIRWQDRISAHDPLYEYCMKAERELEDEPYHVSATQIIDYAHRLHEKDQHAQYEKDKPAWSKGYTKQEWAEANADDWRMKYITCYDNLMNAQAEIKKLKESDSMDWREQYNLAVQKIQHFERSEAHNLKVIKGHKETIEIMVKNMNLLRDELDKSYEKLEPMTINDMEMKNKTP